MPSSPSYSCSSSDSFECDGNSGDNSCSRVVDLGNLSGSCHSLSWIKYLTSNSKTHNDDTVQLADVSERTAKYYLRAVKVFL
jgi:hypothetical protein